jgi:hypothetical protein
VAWLPSGARPARAFGLGSQKAVTEWVGSFDRDNVSRPTVTHYPSSTGSRARRDWTRAAFQIGLFRRLSAFQFRFDRCATRCRDHNVKPSTTFLIRNYFVADCVAYRSREPAETDSMDSSARPGTREQLPAEIRALQATLKSLTPTDLPVRLCSEYTLQTNRSRGNRTNWTCPAYAEVSIGGASPVRVRVR